MSKFTFYRPHDRAATWYTGEELDPITGELITPPSMTKQSFVAECDINNILKQYRTSGMVSHINAQAAQGMYADLPDSLDFQESLNLVLQAEAAFDSLPSLVRQRFQNDPAEFLAFCADPSNKDEMIKLGLAKAPPPPAQEPLVSEASVPQPSPPAGK